MKRIKVTSGPISHFEFFNGRSPHRAEGETIKEEVKSDLFSTAIPFHILIDKDGVALGSQHQQKGVRSSGGPLYELFFQGF